MIGRPLRSADFARVLATPPLVRGVHFVLHHLGPKSPARDLSTGGDRVRPPAVDDCTALRLGSVLPKRHARRAVTRNLLRRQIRAALERRAGALAPGCWVVRLKAPFEPARFASAASQELRRASRDELDALLGRSAGRPA